jgi:hypothetical protein
VNGVQPVSGTGVLVLDGAGGFKLTETIFSAGSAKTATATGTYTTAMNCTLQLTFGSGGGIPSSTVRGILLTGTGNPLGSTGSLVLNTDTSATGDFVVGQMISQ